MSGRTFTARELAEAVRASGVRLDEFDAQACLTHWALRGIVERIGEDTYKITEQDRELSRSLIGFGDAA
jgi:hypothetical protein